MLLLGTQGIGTDLNLNESFRFMDLALALSFLKYQDFVKGVILGAANEEQYKR